ncbi:M23 family metallopeptidase [Aquimarina sp. ERC-38]|uniref:M23 family metallopeptidase n=1 Tax=Aquimarina sp. ERC-38 TaxID=2949996 RepID=UPI002245FC1F|nr:M23 family metallopeptidase [Aquimarina sp. ERC-38]UZO79647.1 M23 family metallopeptidase [Aquimarina sp. ERC-38]
MKYVKALGIFLTLTVLVFLSCTHYQKVADVFLQPTFREKYERNFTKGDTLFLKWKHSFEMVKNDSLVIKAPYTEQLYYSNSPNSARSYQVSIKNGEQLICKVQKSDSLEGIFINILPLAPLNNVKPIDFLVTKKEENIQLDNPGTYQIIVQPEFAAFPYFNISFEIKPAYRFPVSGKNSKAIRSFWGAPRDGGKRSHKGIDIFAKRGTPVVAAVAGRISSTGNRGLGGKQVWLRDGHRGYSLYYAHLDSIAVSGFQKVQVGDTLGFVGNTGNARTTPPHLHFGIYTNRGAIDPLLFVKERKEAKKWEITSDKETAQIKKGTNIRKGPGTSYAILETTTSSKKFMLLGKTTDWYRISLSEDDYGFVHKSLVK